MKNELNNTGRKYERITNIQIEICVYNFMLKVMFALNLYVIVCIMQFFATL